MRAFGVVAGQPLADPGTGFSAGSEGVEVDAFVLQRIGFHGVV